MNLQVQESLYSLGWKKDQFLHAVDEWYMIQNRSTSKLTKWGPLLARNPGQLRFVRLWLDQMKRGGPVRIIAVKSRKVGISTAVAALYYSVCSKMPGWHAGVLAHQQESTDILFSIVRSIHDNIPQRYRPQTRNSKTTELEFGVRSMAERAAGNMGVQSKYMCATAGGRQPFAGATLRLVHFSETAKFPGDDHKQQELIMNVSNAVPPDGPSSIIAESTAQGQRGWHYYTYGRAAGWKMDDDDGADFRYQDDGVGWIPFFSPWHEDPGNRLPVGPSFDVNNWPAEDREREKDLVRRFNLDMEQVAFRRWKIANDCNHQVELFQQDYPSTDLEAFQNSGRPAFSTALLGKQELNHVQPGIGYEAKLREADEDFDGEPVILQG